MPKLEELNAMDLDAFTAAVGPVFEHSPWIAARTWQRRPFATTESLESELARTVNAAALEEKLGLIRAHPDLATREELTPASQNEQNSAGLSNLRDDEKEKFREGNHAYRERFGFPFVICVRLNGKERMLDTLTARLRNSPTDELETALGEIFKIAKLRLTDLINE